MGRRAVLVALVGIGGCTLSLDSKGVEYTGLGGDPIVATCPDGKCGFRVQAKSITTVGVVDVCPVMCSGSAAELPIDLSLSAGTGGAKVTWSVDLEPEDAGIEIVGPKSLEGDTAKVLLGFPEPNCPGGVIGWGIKNKALADALQAKKLCLIVKLDVRAKLDGKDDEEIEQRIDIKLNFYPDDACSITSETCEPL